MSDFDASCICGKKMTRENSRLHPEFFVCDTCAPLKVCEYLKCNHAGVAQVVVRDSRKVEDASSSDATSPRFEQVSRCIK